jgi:hypothetical protein
MSDGVGSAMGRSAFARRILKVTALPVKSGMSLKRNTTEQAPLVSLMVGLRRPWVRSGDLLLQSAVVLAATETFVDTK